MLIGLYASYAHLGGTLFVANTAGPVLMFLIISTPPRWHWWRNRAGQHKAIRDHLQSYHPDEWVQEVIKNNLKGSDLLLQQYNGPTALVRVAEKVTVDGFRERLVRWIISDDQVCISGLLLLRYGLT